MIQQNISKKSEISEAAADEWLKNNPHRTSDHMTGRLAPDSVIRRLRRSTDNACAKPNPDTLIERTRRRKSLFTPNTARADAMAVLDETAESRRRRRLAGLEQVLLNDELLTVSELGKSATERSVTINDLRAMGYDLITLKRGRETIGCCMASAIFDNQINTSTKKDKSS